MPSFQDSAVLILIALLLFGPKGMAQLARQLGKLMGEFRRASSEFRLQMEDEFRASEQAEQQKKIAAMEAAAPVIPAFQTDFAEPQYLHTSPEAPAQALETPLTLETPDQADGNSLDTLSPEAPDRSLHSHPEPDSHPEKVPAPLPIASSGDLHLMPPATGLPTPRSPSSTSSSVSSLFDSIPQTPDPEHAAVTHEAAHG